MQEMVQCSGCDVSRQGHTMNRYPEDFLPWCSLACWRARKDVAPVAANGLLLGDCMDILPGLPAECADMLLTDPPYAVSKGKKNLDRSRWTSPAARQRILVRDFGDWDHFDTPEAFDAFMVSWLREAHRVLRPGANAFVFCILEDCGRLKAWAEAAGFKWVMTVAWCKDNPAPQFVGARQFAYAVEAIGFFRKAGAPVTWNAGNTTRNWFNTPLCQGLERTAHPTQKPLKVLRRLIEAASNLDEVVLDPFVGSGSTAVAAKGLGRRYLAIERDSQYHAIAEMRLAQGTIWEATDA